MQPTQTYIALLRGINVGGKNKLPMSKLVDILQQLHCRDVKTYIQSGNAIFRSNVEQAANLANEIGNTIQQRYGFHPKVLLLSWSELEKAAAKNPYCKACKSGKELHLFFLEEKPGKPDLKKLAALQNDSEQFTLTDRVFYLYTPQGIGRSKLAAGVEKALGVAVTARNWNSICKMLELAQQLA